MICYKYQKPIRKFIFNYNQVTADPNVNETIPESCDCDQSEYKYYPAGHIITGDLSIIKDKELRKLLYKGPKFRIPSKIDFVKCRDVLVDALDNYSKRWTKLEGVEPHALDAWKNSILDIIDIRIDNFHKNPQLYKTTTPTSLKRLKAKFSKLHERFVLAPADKAANNAIII